MTMTERIRAEALTFYRPAEGYVGDVIPFAHNSRTYLFYLHEIRHDPHSGTAWNLVVTDDFTHFEELGPVITSGGPSAADFNAYTGSVVSDGDRVHLFYTGHNPDRLGPDGHTPVQVVMHATSDGDLTTWTKHPDLTFGAADGYEAGDWRDPFVFRASPDEPWRMLLAARHSTGPLRRRGVIAQLQSTDLATWTMTEPFWDPRRYIAHECPDVFQWNDWWYLVYSEFSDAFVTRYRMARSIDGPWLVPAHDTIDGRAFYASKSVERDGRRYFVGWIATKGGEVDDGAWQWAGTMSVLEAHQLPDGTLGFRLPDSVRAGFTSPVDVSWTTGAEMLSDSGHIPTLSAPDGIEVVVTSTELPSAFAARLEVDIAAGTRECGVVLRASADGEEGYILRLEPQRGRLVFDRWPRRLTGPMQWQISGDVPFAVELERPCRLDPGRHIIDLIVDESICVAVIDEEVALSARIYDRPVGRLGLFAGEGEAAFVSTVVHQRSTTPTEKEAQ